MSTMVEATLPADQFALYETLQQYPSAEFDILRLVADGTDRAMPFVWVTGDDLEGLPESVADDPSVENVEVVTELGEEFLLRMEWRAHIRVIIYILVEESATIMDATGKDGCWRFRIFFPERESVSTTYEFCEEYDIDLELDRIYKLSNPPQRGQYRLSEDEFETIVRAYKEGYYDIPREVNLQELADRLDVSHQALSERVRREHQALIANALNPDLETTPST